MEPLLDLLGVALMVQFEEPVENLPPGLRAKRIPDAEIGFPEVVIQIEVRPAVCLAHGQIELNMKSPQLD